MKKIGILTIIDYLNYGNRLQNYAVQEVLSSLGFEVETIVNQAAKEELSPREFAKKRISNALRQSPLKLLQKALAKYKERQNSALYAVCRQKRAASFVAFTQGNIRESDFVLAPGSLPEGIGEAYAYCVAGSDQIWNPHIRFASGLDFLHFVSPEKRVAYAPSFGVSEIPEHFRERYRSYLKEMASLSVREDRGAEIIHELSGREAEVLIDPTLMLDQQKWLALSSPARHKPAGTYLLTYFIGAVSAKRMEMLNSIASVKNLEIVQLNSFNDPERYNADPGEFVDYIRNAEIICTDSFHSSIFAMLTERPFVVFDREGKSAEMSSRLDTLLNKFTFADRKFDESLDFAVWFEIDFAHVEPILAAEREKALRYLRAALP